VTLWGLKLCNGAWMNRFDTASFLLPFLGPTMIGKDLVKVRSDIDMDIIPVLKNLKTIEVS
jgi:hypothetical protein